MKHFSIKLRTILLYNYPYYLILLLSIVYMLVYINNFKPQYKYNITDNTFNLKIMNYNIDGDKLSIEFKGKENIIGTYYFDNEKETEYFKKFYELGDILQVKGTLNYPKNNTIPNTFNYKKYLLYKNVNYLLKIESFEKISDSKDIFMSTRSFFLKRINNINNSEYLYAFILGNSKYLSSEVSNNYKINTVTHLFALSGLHVSVFAGIITKLLKKFNEISSLIITMIILFLLCYITSFTPSILRATIFYMFLSLNKIFYTYIKSKYLLFITFSIMIIINPFYIYNLGFILSFTITYFLLIAGENIKINNKIISLLVISFIAMLGSLPIIINNFYKINIIGFINNIFFVPFVSYIVYPFSLITFVLPFLTPILNILTSIMEIISNISSKILNMTVVFPKISVIGIIVYYVLLILMIKFKKKSYAIIMLILLVLEYNIPKLNKDTCIYFIDVGQGDSILIKSKNNKYILIDTGGKESYYQKIKRNREFNLMRDSMIPFFNSIGIRKIDYLFLTHGDSDHSGYALELINNINVDNIYINKGYINYLEKMITNNILLDNHINVDNINIYSLNNKVYDNENDNSMILLIEIYDYHILLMGDASIKNEKEILKYYNIPKLLLLKLGHHGSNTSTSEELLITTKPDYAIISASLNNKYNHPSKETIDKLNKYNLTYYETSKFGTIKFCLNKNSMKQNTYIP